MKKFIIPFVLCSISVFAIETEDKGYNAYMSGNYEVAKQVFTQAINEDPNNAELYYNRALSEFKLGNISEGNNDLRKAKILIQE
jgi:tetratricopeptide (TPR) repeat protein